VKVFVDSDLLIWHLRGERWAASLLRRLRGTPGNELWTGALQRAEVLFFAKPEEEPDTLALLSLLRTAPVTAEVVDRGAALFRRWQPSHGVDVADALLAATVVEAGGKLVTGNVKHFPMPEVTVERAE